MPPNNGCGQKLIHEKFTCGQYYVVLVDNEYFTLTRSIMHSSLINYCI